MWYDTIREFNMDWKSKSGQLPLAHESKNKKNYRKKKQNKQTPVPTMSGPSSWSMKAVQIELD